MEFRIADTFTDSLARLTGDEQKLVKTTAFDLQMNPANPGHSFHKLDRAKDQNFWSVRVGSDVRLIIHRTATSLLLCYVDHHDDAYRWAERRKLEAHPKTGAAQIVQIRETIRDIEVPRYVTTDVPFVAETPKPKPSQPPLFAAVAEEDLLSYGVPPDWIDAVRKVDEDGLFNLSDVLPAEAAEALLELATGGIPRLQPVAAVGADPFEHPDAQRRFRTLINVDELAEAMDYPWDRWAIFLHPSQRETVDRDFSGPARVSGSAGTGKTVVALHRAVGLARRYPESHALLTTFSPTLAAMLRVKVRRLLTSSPEVGERLEVADLNEVGKRLYESAFGRCNLADALSISAELEAASAIMPKHNFSLRFLISEWTEVVDAWQIQTWDEYRDVRRLGRKTRLPESQRIVLWAIFEKVRQRLQQQNWLTYPALFAKLARQVSERKHPPFDYIVVDEAQDISIPQLKLLASMAQDRPNAIFFAGDLGQRIFQTPFSWKSLGVDIVGRSRTLTINYRTSHQIRSQADRLLAREIADVDGNVEERKGTVSVFNGPAPSVHVATDECAEATYVAEWLKSLIAIGVQSNEIGIFVRSEAQIHLAVSAIEQAGCLYRILGENLEPTFGYASISTMHLAKGLEFKAVAIMACDDEIIPSQERIQEISDDADIEEVYNTERHLLYVAATRAREYLLITSGGQPSEFLDDLTTVGSSYISEQ
jgi:mRNA-degrading endonuclease RelE of RelBE toxin-antitoxin system